MIDKRSINIEMNDDAQKQCLEEESTWEMKSLSSVDDAILAKQSLACVMKSSNEGYITKIGSSGDIEQVSAWSRTLSFTICSDQVRLDRISCDPAVQILTPNFFGRPLESMIDSTRYAYSWYICHDHNQYVYRKWNPFHKKCAILGVMKAISKRNRVVSKHGHVNTYRKEEDATQNHK